jgi:23S rRNA (uracil1939-C5)-methyltransferase
MTYICGVKRKKKNIVLEKILVEDYAAEGKSLARVDGKVIFIENVVPGDLVDLRLTKNKKDWAEGYPVQFHSFSTDRTEPFCQHFGVCGGCQWQMLPYEKQLQYKQRQVEETLRRIGKVPIRLMLPILGAAETRYYRNKLEYTFGNKRFYELPPKPAGEMVEGSNQIKPLQDHAAGFHPKGWFDKIVDIKTCYLQAEPTNAIRLAVKEFAINNSWSFYDIRNHTGFMRNMQVRICTTGEIMINMVVGEKDMEKIDTLMKFVIHRFPDITTLLYTVNEKWNDSLHDQEPVVYHGKGYVIEKLEDFKFKIGPKSFFQTNTMQAEQLYRVTRDFAELSGKEVVYDLYCGTGSIGIFVCNEAKKIIGVEIQAAAIEDARQNAALNAAPAEFFTGDVIEVCNDEFFTTHGRPDVIITDPPRAGMHEKLVNKILDIAAPLVVYVSCNPATQARDLNWLSAKYEVTKSQPVDMFPHTHHIENILQLKLRY